MKEDLKEITITAPVNDTARTKLINIDDNEIINSEYFSYLYTIFFHFVF
jgi:hypothetical protein